MKRKRGVDPLRETSAAEEVLRKQKALVEKRLLHGQKRLNHALKIAKGFERQKLARRLKNESKISDRPRLEAEVAALKSLNLPSLARAHLHKSLLRSKDVTTKAALKEHIAHAQEAATVAGDVPDDPARNNVTARLLNTKPVKLEMKKALDDIYLSLGVLPSRQVVEEQRDSISGPVRPEQESDDAVHPKEVDPVTESVDVDVDPDQCEEEVLGQPVQATFESADPKIHPHMGKKTTYDAEADLPPSSDPDESSSEPMPKSKARSTTKKRSPPRSTTFLPSLTMGGYWSGSESEPEDLDDAQPKKNRPSQRARREQWEKKYGSKAKHLQQASSDGWHPRKGAQAADGNRPGKRPSTVNRSLRVGTTPSQARQKQDLKPDVPLHPSWQAAKRVNAEKRKATFQGKKVVFD